ncbi:MAG: hypothetical protein KIT09_05080 [Bryobacteraceae bacterium]|nr:hypothetical protein [Bryobacteraceae bacterium]
MWGLHFSLAFLSVGIACAQGLWEPRAPFPIEATEVSAAVIDGRVYVVCGVTETGSINHLYIYDPRIDSWAAGPPAPIEGGADHCNVAAAGGHLYILGAIRVGSSFVDGNTYEYDPVTRNWQTVAQMNVPRGASGVAAIGDRIYVAGGLGASGSVASFEVFNISNGEWTVLPDMPTARDHLTAQAVDGKFYAIAGRAGSEFTVNEEFDPATNAWRARAPIPTARGGLGSGVINRRIVVMGGEGASGTPEGTFRENEEYDPETDSWRSLDPMPTPRHGFYGASHDGRIFTPGGGPVAGAFFSSVHDVFYLPPEQPPSVTEGGMRHAASFEEAFAPGALVSLFGDGLSQGEQLAVELPLPMRMNAVEVSVNGLPAPLFYVSDGQINLQLPYDLEPGPFDLRVNNVGVECSRCASGVLLDSAPGIFTLSQSGEGQGAVLIAGTGILAGAEGRPAGKGEVIEIYCSGLGTVEAPPGPGEPAQGPVATLAEAQVTIAGMPAEVLYAGLTPGAVGLYQVNARIPMDTEAGSAVPVVLRMGESGRDSNTVTIAVAE